MYVFLFIAIVLVAVYYATSDFEKPKEGFSAYNGVNEGSSAALNIPPVPSMLAPVSSGLNQGGSSQNVKPSSLPGPLPISPYEQTAAMIPIPYQDTTLIKASKKQLESFYENLKSFLAFESQHLQDKSDPTIQLPLSSSQSDFHHVQNEMNVIDRNPGLQPSITVKQLDEMTSNMEYLKRIIRISENSLGPPNGNSVTEGFFPRPVRRPRPVPRPQPLKPMAPLPVYRKPATQNSNPAQAMQKQNMRGRNNDGNKPATLEDLVNFVDRIKGELAKFTTSSDPVISARVRGLTKIRNDVQDIIDKLKSGVLSPIEVPLKKKDIEMALPILAAPNEPLPKVLMELNLPKGWANALPSNVQKDPDTAREISRLLDKYADTIVNGVSASFNVRYISPREEIVETSKARRHSAGNAGSTIDKSGFPSFSDLDNVSNVKFMPASDGRPVTDRLASRPMDGGRGPSHFDWKQRAKEIEQQVKLRNLDVKDFGIMPQNTKVSNQFSWKGYAQMMCTRLRATMDPALPETCGCPPMDWPGWRS
jgi:hypothetical protein